MYPCETMRQLLRWSFLLALIATAPSLTQAQDEGISRKKQEKTLAKKAKEEKKAKVKQERADREHHLGIQDKETRKRIKKHTRRADKRGSGQHRDGFFSRLFVRKR